MARYFKAIKGTVIRFRKLVETNKSLTRTLNFLVKVLATKNIRYQHEKPARKPFFMNGFFDATRLEAEMAVDTAPPPLEDGELDEQRSL